PPQAGRGPGGIINQIIQLGRDYSAKSIASWKTALRLAEHPLHPNRVKLYDLYADLVYDLHYLSLKRKLLTSATGARFSVLDADTMAIDKDATRLLQSEWFELFVEHRVDTDFCGHTLLQINEANPTTGCVQLQLVPRKNVVPEKGAWLPVAGTHDYQPYRDTPAMDWLIELGRTHDLGWLNVIAKEIIYKKVSFICWSAFEERFGNPMAKAKTNTRDTVAVDKLEKFLREMATNSYAIIDTAEEIEFVQTTQTDSYKVFDAMIERCNSEMSKAILLNIMSSDVGKNGSRSQSEVHAQTGASAISAFLRSVEYSVNNNLFPKLIKHGFNLQGKILKYTEDKSISKETFEQHMWMDDRFDIDHRFFADTYGVPIKGRKENVAETTSPNERSNIQNVLRGDFHSFVKMHAAIEELYNHKH
ncbi:MAG TPA: DUF935 family protein, partial [Chitinophagales bacterium]|nr:DUF935 family protein [Chitinophagales bacterium]